MYNPPKIKVITCFVQEVLCQSNPDSLFEEKPIDDLDSNL